MTTPQILALLPLIILALTAIVVMLVSACCRNHRAVVILTLLGLITAFGSIAIAAQYAPIAVARLLVVDPFALLFTGILLLAGFFVTLFAYGYLEKHPGTPGEFYILLVLALLGAVTLVSAAHFASFFLGLEILSISLYALLAYLRTNPLNIEAGIKYLVLSSVSSAFLLFGMALVYAELGTMAFTEIAARTGGGHAIGVLTMAGLGLIIVGFGFKLALAPFYFWTPDVYQGAPAPATAFIATVSKGAVFALLLRFFLLLHVRQSMPLLVLFTVLAIASMFIGNLLALHQDNVKRLLAYSSIANMGYLLVAFLAGGPQAATAFTFFLIAYIVTILGAFGIVAIFSSARREADTLLDYRALAWRHPWLAGAFTVMLLSLAGIPLTAGFLGKFYLLLAGVQSHLWLLAIILVVNSAVSLYYYLRVIIAMYTHPREGHPEHATPHLTAMDAAALTVLTIALFWLGIYPGPLIRLIDAVVRGF